MTQQEFFNRTNVEVSSKEYEAIEMVYMNSDLDKDTFCKMWVKMNQTRVEQAKKEELQRTAEETKRNYLYDFLNQNFDWTKLATEYVSYDESKKFKEYGFDVEEYNPYIGINMFKSISTFVFEIKQYLGIA